MISKSGVHLPDTTYGGNPIAWKNADDSDEGLRRIRDENAKLRELAKQMHICLTRPKVYDGEQPYLTATECPYFTEGACDYNACAFEQRMRELGVEL